MQVNIALGLVRQLPRNNYRQSMEEIAKSQRRNLARLLQESNSKEWPNQTNNYSKSSTKKATHEPVEKKSPKDKKKRPQIQYLSKKRGKVFGFLSAPQSNQKK